MESTAETFPSWEGGSTGMLVPRETLDDILLSRAREAGARFETATARKLIRDGSRVTGVVVETPTETLRVPARYVVVAIGSANARFFQSKRRLRPSPAVGLAGRVGLRRTGDIGDYLEFYFPLFRDSQVLSAYGWVFPDGATRANVGVGVVRTARSGRILLGKLIDEFVSWLVATDDRFSHAELCSPMRAASIAGFPGLDSEPGLLTVGDAAGIANPFTGEGIASALESGELAAQVISRSAEDAHRFYEESIRDHFPQVHRLRPSVASIHSQPWIILGRGWDVILSPQSRTGRALKSFLWDVPPARTPLDLIPDPLVQDALTTIRTDLEQAIGRLPPLTGELVRAMVVDSENGIGWCTAFASTVRRGLSSREAFLTRDVRRVLTALELIGLVGAAHCDLPKRSSPRSHSWGRKTLALLIADSLNVEILAITSGLSQPWRGFLTTLARRVFRRAAAAQSDKNAPAEFVMLDELFRAAGFVGVPNDAHMYRNPVATVATSLAGLRAPALARGQVVPNSCAAVRRLPARLRAQLEEILSLAARPRMNPPQRIANPPCYRLSDLPSSHT